MSANVPIVRQVSWPAIIIIILVWGLFIATAVFFFQKHGYFIGVVLFILITILLQQAIPKNHNKGMKVIKQKDFKNIAFCYVQTMEAEKAKALYEQILKEYPDNGIAYYSLNSINTFSDKAN